MSENRIDLINFGGIVPLSTVDWLGRSALVVFLRGCPLRCPHCHNIGLRSGDNFVDFHVVASRIVSQIKGEMKGNADSFSRSPQINLDEASERVRARPFVDAFVLSGGEPLQQSEAAARLFCLARSLHLDTGLETSGCYPDRLRELLKSGYVDKIFLDLKAAVQDRDYQRATGEKGVAARVRESLEICMESGIAFDVRTTVFPDGPTKSEVVEVAELLSRLRKENPGSRLESFVLQQGRPRDGGPRFEPVSIQTLQEMADTIGLLENVKIRALPSISWQN
jgi:pyruvate formate lyase activating enzyme